MMTLFFRALIKAERENRSIKLSRPTQGALKKSGSYLIILKSNRNSIHGNILEDDYVSYSWQYH